MESRELGREFARLGAPYYSHILNGFSTADTEFVSLSFVAFASLT
jgi:hypothetical protein